MFVTFLKFLKLENPNLKIKRADWMASKFSAFKVSHNSLVRKTFE